MNTLRLNIINLHSPTSPYLQRAIEEFSETISLLFDVEDHE